MVNSPLPLHYHLFINIVRRQLAMATLGATHNENWRQITLSKISMIQKSKMKENVNVNLSNIVHEAPSYVNNIQLYHNSGVYA